MQPAVAPLGAALAFTICEWLRSIGVLAAPFDQLGYTQADTPLRAIAAFGGTYSITLVICIVAAYAADAVARRTWKPFAVATVAAAMLSAAAWAFWPARHLARPTIEVAAVQGNIPQSLKWNALRMATQRYATMTRALKHERPRLVAWPETAIPTELNFDFPLLQRFTALSHALRATIVVGSIDANPMGIYNALWILAPDGASQIYHKRQLVPFAEWFPGHAFLSWLPYIGALNGGLTPGSGPLVYKTNALAIAPLICWESAFADLAYEQMRANAQVLVISTDDAWFGNTSGPYMHAQIAQLRAVETGAYVVRAAATGISGIIAPDGRWQARSALERRAVINGRIGPPVRTLFSRVGPTTLALLMIELYAALLFLATRPQIWRGDDA